MLIKAHKKQRYGDGYNTAKKFEERFKILKTIPRDNLEKGFLKYMELTETPAIIMKANAFYGANTILNKAEHVRIDFWKANIKAFSTECLVGMLLGDFASSGYSAEEIEMVYQKEILPLFGLAK